ncbi:MAG: CRISPR-associated endonuclease Cas2 [Bacteroidales bacterium]|nr:CRISPR-associated endonuclease Cas2 [Bacteroidales bacterium]
MRKPKTALDYKERLLVMKNATFTPEQKINREIADIDKLPTLEQRVKKIIGIVNDKQRKIGNMLFFVMYDIESNKVRYNVVKYLQKQGCTRIQKSIFLADLDSEKYREIRSDLTEIQSLYENHDSIIICPVSTEQINAMKVIGQEIAIDVITHSKNTLFF